MASSVMEVKNGETIGASGSKTYASLARQPGRAVADRVIKPLRIVHAFILRPTFKSPDLERD
jgi:hypothetical protein